MTRDFLPLSINQYLTDIDYKFFDFVNTYKPYYELIMERSLNYELDISEENFTNETIIVKINGQNKKLFFCPIFLVDNLKIEWISNYRKLLYSHLLKFLNYHELDNYVSLDTLKLLFNSKKIEFEKKYIEVLPLLIAFTNPAFNLIRFRCNNITLYCLINLDII